MQNCIICQADKPTYYKPPLNKALKKGIKPFTVVHVDLFYLPSTKEGDNAILLTIDAFSKFIEAQLLRDDKAEIVW